MSARDPNDDELRARAPIDPRTGEPLPPRAKPGYYPGYETMAQREFWDEATRAVVVKRVEQVPPIRFFSPWELPIARALFDRVLPQDDRDEAHRVPIVHYVDERLYERKLDGYRFEDMPDEPWAHRLGLRAIDAIARRAHGRGFAEIGARAQEEILKSIHDGAPMPGAESIWEQMSVKHYWHLVVQDAAAAYYAHPWAWDEIGFGGPAYPRGYMRLEHGAPEPWEVDERRYAWEPPPGSPSAEYTPEENVTSGSHPGQSGTH